MSAAIAVASPVAAPEAKSVDPTEARRQRGLAIADVTKIEQRKEGFWTVLSMDPNPYAVTEPELLRTLRLS